jgi:DNA polymerase/3'-5' exonuclease PolX
MITGNRKNELLSLLGEILSLYIKSKDVFRTRAFSRAISSLTSLDEIPTTLEKLKSIENVGKSIAECIVEFHRTGKIERLRELRNDKEKEKEDMMNIETDDKIKEETLSFFQSIYGVGEKTSQKWYDSGIRTLQDIFENWTKLTSAQQIGVLYREQLQERIPYIEITLFEKLFKELFPKLKFEVCGSYRRKNETSGDIDILVMKKKDNNTLEKIVDKLKTENIILSILSLGKIKFMGVVQIVGIARRIDISMINEDSWPYALLHATGSSGLNIMMRDKAIHKGWMLNEYGLYDNEKNLIKCESEEEIFKKLGMAYISPEDRNVEF